jgi:ribosomal protein L37E
MTSIFHRLSNKISKSLSKDANEESSTGSSSVNQRSSTIQKIYCRFCGKDNPVSSEYCLQCRMPIKVPPSQVMKVCEKCGLAVNDDSVYCYSCGTIFFNGV